MSSTFYERNPSALPWKGRLVEGRSQETILRNAFSRLKHVRSYRGLHLWSMVGDLTGHGSGYSQQICEELGWAYDMPITPTAKLPDRVSREGPAP
jgi:hypothetical protein